MADRTNQIGILYKKDGTKVAEGVEGKNLVSITGLTEGTVVATGDYQISCKDTITDLESSKVDVEGFTVFLTPEVPTNVKTDATADGANITFE
ncbi:hypothetical protein M5C72_07090 [Companilactobacillus allii]|uniref:Uncharacterized protein n=1 Tax=Companilactobacillus allii TaxID=1847728 RepID=A0A1P8Q4T0_9LACO|nr:hypothetical protein [Companilactobacillus allii]APX72862.1 hypothetical protein BTM29_10005 [Companilactobacillus allii]USQ67650.1 hypothetical protein M5C72_07090 [Companilactobacillus allii]